MTPNKDSMTNYDTIIDRLNGLRGYEVADIEEGEKVYIQRPACGGHHDVSGGHISDFEEELCDECQAINRTLDQAIAIIEQVRGEEPKLQGKRVDGVYKTFMEVKKSL